MKAWVCDDDPETNLCGTRACTAGLAIVFGDDPRVRFIPRSTELKLPDGSTADIDARAKMLLELTEEQDRYLFSARRSRQEVLDALDALIASP